MHARWGGDRRTLFVPTAQGFHRKECRVHRTARTDVVDIDVRGAGLP
jgi:hypothetical protein